MPADIYDLDFLMGILAFKKNKKEAAIKDIPQVPK